MAGITLTEAIAKLQTWLDADEAVAGGQAYTVKGKSMTKADAKTINDNIVFWDKKVRELSPRRKSRVRYTSN